MFVLSVETVIPVELWNPSVPELPEVPAACTTEGAYMIAYAPRSTVLLSTRYAKPIRGPQLFVSIGTCRRLSGVTKFIAPRRFGRPGTLPAIGEGAVMSK